MTIPTPTPHHSQKQMWSAVGSMTLCVAMLIASEFMPVSLLTPIADDLHATQGMAGQAISVSGFFAVLTSLLIASFSGRFDRRHILLAMTLLMLSSLIMIALAPNFTLLMVARAFLGMAIGGFWSLSTATVLQLVPENLVPKALGMIYMGNSLATAFAAPIGAWLGGVLGCRAVFWGLVPLVIINIIWQLVSLPAMPPKKAIPVSRVFGLLKRRNVGFGMLAVMFSFAGAFTTFTYLRPFLETKTGAGADQLSLLLLGLGAAGFMGTWAAGRLLEKEHLYGMLRWLPVVMAVATLGMLLMDKSVTGVACMMVLWGAVNAAVPVCWSTWLAKAMSDEPESGGGLMVACIQLSIMLGGAFGGVLLDRISVIASFTGGIILLVISSLVIGRGNRVSHASIL